MQVGDLVKGKVINIKQYGIFIHKFHLSSRKRHTHHTSVPNKLNLYIAPFSVRSALCRTALFSDAAKTDNNSRIIKAYPPLKECTVIIA